MQWSEVDFRRNLAKLNSEDVKALLIRLFESKVPAVKVRVGSGDRISDWELMILGTNHSMLISGLVGKLAKEDFTDTVSWLDSLPIFQTNTQLSRFVYDEIISAGAAQSPREAWLLYQQKGQPSTG